MNVSNLRKGDLEDLNKIMKSALRDKQCHRKQSIDEVYNETKVRVACHKSVSTDKCIAIYLRDKLNKEQKLMKGEGENTTRRVNVQVLFNVMIGNEIYR